MQIYYQDIPNYSYRHDNVNPIGNQQTQLKK